MCCIDMLFKCDFIQGEKGLKGNHGLDGVPGTSGLPGAKGEMGDLGLPGPQVNNACIPILQPI